MFNAAYLIRALIFAQPLFWMWLYDRDVDLSAYRNTFYVLSCAFCFAALSLSVTVDFVFQYYTAWLLFLYAFMVIMVTYILEEKWGFRRGLCLGFLVVFLNSYVWEFMLHLTSYLSNGIKPNDVLQMWHLIALYWILKKFRIVVDKKVFLTGVQRLLLVETVIAIFVIEVIGKGGLPSMILPFAGVLKGSLYNFNRLFSLTFLIIPLRFLAVEKDYKGTVYIFRQGVASVCEPEERLDKGISRN